MAEFVEERDHVAVREQRRFPGRRCRPVAQNCIERRPHGAVGQNAPAVQAGVCEVRELPGAWIEIEIEGAARRTCLRIGYGVSENGRVPARQLGRGGERQPEQVRVDAHYRCDHVGRGKVLPDRFAVDAVARFANLVLNVGDIPRFERRAFIRCELRPFGAGLRQQCAAEAVQKRARALEGAGHPIGCDIGRPVREMHQLREAVARAERLLEELHVRFAAAPVVGDIVRLARVAVRFVRVERADRAFVDRDDRVSGRIGLQRRYEIRPAALRPRRAVWRSVLASFARFAP